MVLYWIAWAYTLSGLMEDPGCRLELVARFWIRLAVFSPRPPTTATIFPS